MVCVLAVIIGDQVGNPSLQTMNCWEMCKCAHAELVPMLIVAYHAISCCLSHLMIISARTWNLEFSPSLLYFVIMLERFGVGCRLEVVLVCMADDSSDLLLEIVISPHSLHLFIGSVD